jgi:hypothetical protein
VPKELAMVIACKSRRAVWLAPLFILAFGVCGKPLAQTVPSQPEDAAPPKDYLLPALEIIGFDFLLNRFNRYYGSNRDDYAVSRESIRRNLHSSWVIDTDPFRTNQLGHPYQGSMYHGFARSAGLS